MYDEQTLAKVEIIRQWLQAGSINFFGYPLAGKDTQGSLMAELLGTRVIGGGDILRNSVIPERSQRIMAAGGLIPTEDYLQIVLPFLSQDDFKNKPLVLSAVGRWSGEEQGVIAATAQAGHNIKAVVALTLDEGIIWERLKAIKAMQGADRGERFDDEADVIERRLEEFRVKTAPVIDFYRSLDLVIDINSDRDIHDVHLDIIDKLASHALASQ